MERASTTAAAKASGASCGRLCPASGTWWWRRDAAKWAAPGVPSVAGKFPWAWPVSGTVGGGSGGGGARGDGDRRQRAQLLLEVGVAGVAVGVPQAVPVGVQHHLDVVRVVESLGGTVQDVVPEGPRRRVAGPDHLGDVTTVRGEAGAAALGEEVVEVPEPGLQLGPDRVPRRGQVLDEVTVDAHQAAAPLGPEGGDDARRAAAPVVAGEHGPVDPEGVQEGHDVRPERSLLPGPRGGRVEEASR